MKRMHVLFVMALLVIPLATIDPGLAAMGAGATLLGGSLVAVMRRWGAPSRPKNSLPPPDASTWPTGRSSAITWAEVAPILGAGLLIRFAVVLLVNRTSLWLSFGPDAIGWEALGRQTAQFLSGRGGLPGYWSELSSRTFYASLNGFLYGIFGSARIPMSLLNSVVGTCLAFLVGKLATDLYGREAGRRALWLALFFPSLVLWHAQNLREVWAHLAIVLVLLAGLQVRRRVQPSSFLMLFAALAGLAMIRTYLVALVVVALGISLVLVRPKQLPYAVLALVVLAAGLTSFGETFGVEPVAVSEASLERIQKLRTNLAYGGSAYGAEADTTTLSGTIRYLPEGLARFLFSPFPWEVRSWQQALAAPEALAWAFLFMQGMIFVVRNFVRDLVRISLPLTAATLLTLAYALVSGNEGTAFRHRSQVMVIAFVFTAAAQTRPRREPQAVTAPGLLQRT